MKLLFNVNEVHKKIICFQNAQVKATDDDLSRTTNMRYRLLGEGTQPGDQQLFTIDPTSGTISLINGLNRDEPLGKSEYIFTVEAQDEDIDPQKGYTNIKVMHM